MNNLESSPQPKSLSLIICLMVYLVAIAAAWYSLKYFTTNNLLLTTLIADVGATLVVFIFSVVFKNASLYDPYWSVAPPFIICFWIVSFQSEISLTGFLVLGLTILWSLRLTINWIKGWKGISHEDWRYIQLRNENPELYPIINLAGIHLFPSMIVFSCLIPAYYLLMESNVSINLTILTGAFICIAAILISYIADEQMRAFRNKSTESECMESGLWKYSRHPNYMGEILFWIGIWIISLGVNINLYWTIFGCVTLIFMFVFISIPMMEKRNLSKRKKYSDVIQRVPMLFKLWP